MVFFGCIHVWSDVSKSAMVPKRQQITPDIERKPYQPIYSFLLSTLDKKNYISVWKYKKKIYIEVQ